MFYIGPMCNRVNTESSWDISFSSLILVAMLFWIMYYLLTQKHFGNAHGNYCCQVKLKIFYGKQVVMHFLPCPIWFVAVSLMIQHVPTAQTNMKMCRMRFGTVQAYLQFGMKTLNGILGEIWVFQCSHGLSSLGTRRSDFLYQVFLLIKFRNEQLLLLWSFGQHNQRSSPQ